MTEILLAVAADALIAAVSTLIVKGVRCALSNLGATSIPAG